MLHLVRSHAAAPTPASSSSTPPSASRRARGKIERFFGTVTSELLPTLPGHIPRGTDAKPVTDPQLSLAELDTAISQYLLHRYHQRPHSETGQPPVQRWSAGGWLPRMRDSLEQLDLLLLTVAHPSVVHRDEVHCHGLRYLDLTLAAYVGETVTVRYDHPDLAEVWIYHQGTYLCRAVAPELAAVTISLKDLQAARNRRRADLRHQLSERHSLADALTTNTRQPIPAGAVLAPRPPQAASADDPAPSLPRRLKTYRED